MRAMITLVVAMGVMIVAGVAVVAVTLVGRLGGRGPAPNLMLDQPAGTRIIAASFAGGQLAVVLQGGGPDRVVVVDAASGREMGGVRLAR